MAATGTISARWTDNHHWYIAVRGVLQGSSSASFTGKSLPFSSFVVTGPLAGATLQVQGSNDGGLNYTNTGAILSTDPIGGTITPGGMSFGLYLFQVIGGGPSTLVNIDVMFSPSS